MKDKIDKFLTDNFNDIVKLQDSNSLKWRDICKQILGYEGESEYVRNRFRKIKDKIGSSVNSLSNISSTSKDKFIFQSGKESKEKGTKEWTFTASSIPTEEEIIEHFNIDTKKWKIVNIYHKTSFGGKYSITVQTNLLKGIESENYTEKFDKFIEEYNKTIFVNNTRDRYKEENIDPQDILYLIGLSDLHIGNYQIEGYLQKIKEKVFYTIDSAKEFSVNKIIILNTGDMLHTNGSQETTLGGTQLDSQLPFEDAFTQGLDFTTSIIDYGSDLGIEIVFINVRGNHSFDTEYCLGEALKKVYQKRKNIEIINNRDTRIYYHWKNNAFLFTHGDKAVERLPLLFATEGKESFQKADNHHIILGHLHHNKGKQFIDDRAEFAGIEVRVLGSPTSNDIWHKQNGFCQNKKSVIGMMFTPQEGKYAEFNFKLFK